MATKRKTAKKKTTAKKAKKVKKKMKGGQTVTFYSSHRYGFRTAVINQPTGTSYAFFRASNPTRVYRAPSSGSFSGGFGANRSRAGR